MDLREEDTALVCRYSPSRYRRNTITPSGISPIHTAPMPAMVIRKLSPKTSPWRILPTAWITISAATAAKAASSTAVETQGVPGRSARNSSPAISSAAPTPRVSSSLRTSAGSCSWLWSWPQLQPPWSW